MKATLRVNVNCPLCGGMMFRGDGCIYCVDPFCANNQKKFKTPEIEIELVECELEEEEDHGDDEGTETGDSEAEEEPQSENV